MVNDLMNVSFLCTFWTKDDNVYGVYGGVLNYTEYERMPLFETFPIILWDYYIVHMYHTIYTLLSSWIIIWQCEKIIPCTRDFIIRDQLRSVWQLIFDGGCIFFNGLWIS